MYEEEPRKKMTTVKTLGGYQKREDKRRQTERRWARTEARKTQQHSAETSKITEKPKWSPEGGMGHEKRNVSVALGVPMNPCSEEGRGDAYTEKREQER